MAIKRAQWGRREASAVSDTGGRRRKKPWCGKFGRIFMRFLFSHIGLFILLSLYSVGGAYMFIETEYDDDRGRYQAQMNAKEALKLERKNMTSYFDTAKPSEAEIDASLQRYQALVALKHGDVGYTHDNSTGTITDFMSGWEFPSAVLFAVSIITLIGYGHVAPTTEIGQILVIPYALIGVPLMLMFMANVGDLLASGIRFMYSRSCGKVLDKKRGVKDIDRQQITETPDGKPIPEERVRVPIIITAVILVAYVMLGTLIFSLWEKWSVASSTYFSFVTLATIGFGDYVPGWQSVHSLSGKFKLIVSALYIVIGLAFISMGFNLMIDQMMVHTKSVAAKLGYRTDPEEEKERQKCNLEKFVKRKAPTV